MNKVAKKNMHPHPVLNVVESDIYQTKCRRNYGFDSEQQIFDDILVNFSVRVLNSPFDLLEKEIEKGLQEMHSFFGCDRVMLWEISEDGQRADRTHSFLTAGDIPLQDALWHETLPFIISRIQRRQDLRASRLQELPQDAHVDKQWLMQCGIRSFAVIPLIVDGDLRGALSLSFVMAEHVWSDRDIANIKNIGSVFSGALDRKRSHYLLNQKIQFETLITDLSARLITAPTSDIDVAIEQALTHVRKFFHGDRCALLSVSEKNTSCWVTHGSYAESLDHVSGDINLAELFPWSYERLVLQGKHKNISSIKELPPEAKVEFESWSAMGIRSALSVPIFVEGRVVSLIAINAIYKEQFWPEEYVSRLRLLGEICLGALRRRTADSTLRENKARLQAQLREIRLLKQKIEKENLYLREETFLLSEHSDIIAESKKMKNILLQVEQVARTNSTALITGETGTGKELVARQIHKLSTRKGRPMVTVNCASLQPTLIESELFGREKGAYTGAMTKMAGRFEVADGSTLFLDEIGELPLDLQSKLLRVLEEGTFERLGSTKTIRVDVRVIAATNRDLLQDVRRGTFRQDLFYRLNVFPIIIPPLRKHIEDLAPLIWAFVRQLEKKMGKQIENIPLRSLEALQHYGWPGNIRELRNVVEHAMIVSHDRTLRLSLPATSYVEESERCDLSERHDLDLEAVEREHILKALQTCDWRMSGPGGAAQALGLKRTTLQSKMKKLAIKRPSN